MQPIPDKAEISLDFPDKTYIGAFGRDSRYEVRIEPDAVLVRFVHSGGAKRVFEMHIHHHLMADLTAALAKAVREQPIPQNLYRELLLEAVRALEAALAEKP